MVARKARAQASVDLPIVAFNGIEVSRTTPNGRTAEGREAALSNNARPYTALLAWADRHVGGAGLHFCLEATGHNSDGHAAALAEVGQRTSVADPALVKAHAAAG